MKKVLFLTLLSMVFVLGGCASLDNYESRLEDEGWDVETATVEDLPDFIDSDEIEETSEISGVLYASKNGTNFGFIIEFSSSSGAEDAYDELVDDSDEDYEGNIRQQGAFLFLGVSSEFLEDLGLE